MWIETRILFSFMESLLFSFSSSCSAFWIEVERALFARWKTRDGACVPPGISRVRPWNFVLVFSTHAPHQGAFSRLPCSPRLCGEREKSRNGHANPGFRWRSTLGY